MEHTAYLVGCEFLKSCELINKDNEFPLGVVTLHDAQRAIRHALSKYSKLLNPYDDEPCEKIAKLEE